MRLVPRSLFGRTACLIAFTLLVYSIIVWQAVMWAVVVPTADLTADVLVQRAVIADSARRAGLPPPPEVAWSAQEPPDTLSRFRGFAYGVYLERLRSQLRSRLNAADVVISHARAPAQVAIRMSATDDGWLLLSVRLARPEAPAAFVAVMVATAVLVLAAAAWSARRLTRPLAQLARAADRIEEGELLPEQTSGPGEVRALAAALRSMSNRLTALNEERELMLAGISHDLRSPLARMRVAVELLATADTALREQITAEIEEMDRMVGVFLHYVRAGYREIPVRASLDGAVAEALGPLAHDSRLQLRYGAPDVHLLNVAGVRHIVFNLVQNALEHGRPPVEVTTATATNEVELCVADAGPGIQDQEWDRALRPFDRLRATPGSGHAGLGLALVDRLVRAARGTLRATRTDRGFEIRVSFPAARDTGT
ncbi:MAG TPA: ATP-binding protein [Steroidobacteraceae bacterium]|nr:ATP-binding protein [Steroidobacteraceae bacterium]